VADRDRGRVTRDEARTAFARLLIERVRRDKHPSVTQMNMLEASLPPWLMRDYLNILFAKTLNDNHPSIPMLRRIQRLTEQL
jgi:hypothetical protein